MPLAINIFDNENCDIHENKCEELFSSNYHIVKAKIKNVMF